MKVILEQKNDYNYCGGFYFRNDTGFVCDIQNNNTKRLNTKMKIEFQEYEVSKRIFRNAYLHPEGKNLEYRRLQETFWFIIDGKIFEMSPGFWWDGASIPQIFWSIIGDPWSEDIAPGALIHDVLYATQYYERWKADEILYEVNKLNKMNTVKNHLVYRAVRTAGWKAYSSKTDKQIEGACKHLTVNGRQFVP